MELNLPPVYKLLETLWVEAQLVDLTAKLISSAAVICIGEKKPARQKHFLKICGLIMIMDC